MSSNQLALISPYALDASNAWPLARVGEVAPQGLREHLTGYNTARIVATVLMSTTLFMFCLSIFLASAPIFLLVLPLGILAAGGFMWEDSQMYRRLDAADRPDHWSRLVDAETVPQYKIETSGDHAATCLRLVRIDWRADTSAKHARKVLEEHLFTDTQDIERAIEAKLGLLERRDELNHTARAEYLASLETARDMHKFRQSLCSA